ncbi:MAG: hypothetical protein K2L16_06155 [Muribaculaceae bacterium]|nr:hypothetical protein [Muribaculaceae bacterium]
MKKFYTLLAAAACVAGANAGTYTMVANPDATPRANGLAAELNVTSFAPAKAAPVTGQWNNIGIGKVSEGLICDISADLGAMAGDTWEITIEQSASDANWYRTILYNENSPVVEANGGVMESADNTYFYFNVANPAKVYSEIYKIYESEGSGFEVYQAVTETGIDKMLANQTSPTYQGIINGLWYGKFENGVVTFPKNSFFNLDREAGSFFRIDQSGEFAIALPGSELPVFWNSLGTATWNDGIMGAMFIPQGQQAKALVSQTEVQENTAEPGVYRLVSPWLEWFDSNDKLIIDMSDPTCGVVDQQATGIVDQEMGLTYILSRSINYANGTDGFKADTEAYRKYNITMDSNRTITLPGNSCFYYWPDADAEHLYSSKADVVSTITIPENAGVNDVVVENQNAPVEYFNLQGVRVANPANGIYIMRQGNKTSKVFVR